MTWRNLVSGYTLEILQSAQIYAEHAQRQRDGSNTTTALPLEIDDLRLAVSSKLEHSYSSALPKEFLMPLAAQINRVPLPILPESYGIRLPPDRERLTAVNWDLIPLAERRTYPEAVSSEQLETRAAANGSSLGNGMDIDLSREDLFGRQDADEEEDVEEGDEGDEEDEEDMEEVVDPALRSAVEQDQEEDDVDGEAEGDNEGDEDGNENDGEGNANGGEEDDDYDA